MFFNKGWNDLLFWKSSSFKSNLSPLETNLFSGYLCQCLLKYLKEPLWKFFKSSKNYAKISLSKLIVTELTIFSSFFVYFILCCCNLFYCWSLMVLTTLNFALVPSLMAIPRVLRKSSQTFWNSVVKEIFRCYHSFCKVVSKELLWRRGGHLSLVEDTEYIINY